MLIFSFLVKISRSITWPPQGQYLGHIFWQTFLEKCGQVIDLEVFTCFFVKTCFFKNLILPAERRILLKNKKTTQNNTIKVAKLLTHGGQVIDPTAYIYILWSYYLGHVWGFLIVTNWATFVFLKRLFVKKHYKNRGFSRFLVQEKGTHSF